MIQSLTQEKIGEKFKELAARWKAERGVSSSVTEMAMQPSYQQIIGLGPSVIPYLLEEMRSEPDHWFWALHAITGENPVPAGCRGNLQKMSQAWLTWGCQQGYSD